MITSRATARRGVALLSSGLCRKSLASHPSPSTNPGRTTGIFQGRRRPCAETAIATLFSGGRALSSYEWNNMSKEAQKANKEFAKLSTEAIRKAGEEELDKVEKALKGMEPFNDIFTVRREGLEIFAELAPHVGTYWIKFDTSLNQICLLSPRSGPHRYIYDKESGRWIGEADKHDFEGMLTRDIIQSASGIPDF